MAFQEALSQLRAGFRVRLKTAKTLATPLTGMVLAVYETQKNKGPGRYTLLIGTEEQAAKAWNPNAITVLLCSHYYIVYYSMADIVTIVIHYM